MEIRQLYEAGVSISELARRFGYDRKTIRSALNSSVEEKQGERASRGERKKGSKLEPYKDYVKQRMQLGVLNAVRILREIREQGYTGGITVLREFMKPLRPVVSAKATERYESDPGEQAQIDLGAFPYYDSHGQRRTIWAFAMVLAYSRMLYVEFIKAADQLHILQALRNALEFFGGVPRVILSDNCSSLVVANDGQGHVDWQPAYLDFAKFYGFVPKACRPRRSQTKGKVERPIRYIRDNFWPVAFVDEADLNRQVAWWRDHVANVRIHGTTHEQPIVRFQAEKLQPLPATPYMLACAGLRKVMSDCRVSWNTNLYTVPWRYVGHTVLVREFESGRLQIEYGGQVIAEHCVLSGKHQISTDPEHYKNLPRDTANPARGKTAGWQVDPDVEQRELGVYEQIAMGGHVQ
ncbi:IS21 family transposase [Alicyclobacillus acidocaldarius]|uniref:Integrase catalytic region n=1 Tax=Alicyclobacillus acidocaldarius (strain Tc-4-1) TaxID=1048834 RepID=F8IGT8_ALIAT|nr:IS21 family transposase [Alicyclobacillus acidocaldarius]AEJ43103.1 Integrase catalytic region [Alicyclobacillus acidocaldarius subsp. acidocaldarius Tc-4-1]